MNAVAEVAVALFRVVAYEDRLSQRDCRSVAVGSLDPGVAFPLGLLGACEQPFALAVELLLVAVASFFQGCIGFLVCHGEVVLLDVRVWSFPLTTAWRKAENPTRGRAAFEGGSFEGWRCFAQHQPDPRRIRGCWGSAPLAFDFPAASQRNFFPRSRRPRSSGAAHRGQSNGGGYLPRREPSGSLRWGCYENGELAACGLTVDERLVKERPPPLGSKRRRLRE